MNATDQYLMSQVGPMLAPGEQVLFMSTMRRVPSIWLQMLMGGFLTFLVTKSYLVVLTNQKMVLFLSKQGMFGGVKQLNLGVEAWDIRTVTYVQTGGFLANKSMTFFFANGPKQTLRITPQLKTVSGTKDFFQQVPGLLNSGQLGNQVIPPGKQQPAQQLPPGQPPPAQLPPGQQQQAQPGYDPYQMQQPGQMPPQQQPPQYGAPQQQPPQQQYGAPPQQEPYAPQQQQPPQQQYAPPPHQQPYAPPQQQQPQYAPPPPQQHQQQGPFPPGTQVVVTAPDGSRHLASIVQEQQGHYLCAGPAGQGWVPAQFVARA